MKEQLSALMDDQLDGPECEGCLRRLKDDDALRDDWAVYHLIGDALRGTPARGLPAAFAERLAAEPTVLAPRAMPKVVSPRRKAWYGLSAAASVAAVAAVGWMAVNVGQAPVPGRQPEIAAAPAGSATPVTAVIPVAQGVGDYVLAHQRYSPRTAMAGVMPYVGSMADDAGRR
jgi:sigma-E factor negative regulatory protein RseA